MNISLRFLSLSLLLKNRNAFLASSIKSDGRLSECTGRRHKPTAAPSRLNKRSLHEANYNLEAHLRRHVVSRALLLLQPRFSIWLFPRRPRLLQQPLLAYFSPHKLYFGLRTQQPQPTTSSRLPDCWSNISLCFLFSIVPDHYIISRLASPSGRSLGSKHHLLLS
jgi:hypothetical protein